MTVFSIREYVCPKSLSEAYAWNQEKGSAILGGLLWLKMGKRKISKGIDLKNLGLSEIIEEEDCFRIGCMATLRQVETHEGLCAAFGGCMQDALSHIVGVQFRNLATVGGSIYSRFGFSDPLTLFLALDADVVLYQRGRIPLSDFLSLPPDRDILLEVVLKKQPVQTVYLSQRMTETDFPVLTVCVSKGAKWRIAIGARPARAMLVSYPLPEQPGEEALAGLFRYLEEEAPFATNMRASGAYRRHLAGVLVKRGVMGILGGAYEN